MTETPETFPLPSSYRFGWIRGRFIQWILDTLADEDAKPEARPALGEIVLTPAESLRRVTDLDYPALVTSGRIVVPIADDGTIRDANGSTTIALVTGIYRVEFNLTTGTIPSFSFEVTAEHTRELPLDLAAAAPVQPPSGTPTELLPVPVGGQPGQVLQMMADGSLAWGYPAAGPESLPMVKIEPNTAEGATVAGTLDVWRVGDTVFARFKFVRISGWTRWEPVFIVPPGYGGDGAYVYAPDSPGGAPGFYISGRNLQLVGESTGELRATVAWRAGELMPS